MTITAPPAALATSLLSKVQVTESPVQSATQRLHRAEVALHDAHTTHVDAWITAAADRLHEAVENYLVSLAA